MERQTEEIWPYANRKELRLQCGANGVRILTKKYTGQPATSEDVAKSYREPSKRSRACSVISAEKCMATTRSVYQLTYSDLHNQQPLK